MRFRVTGDVSVATSESLGQKGAALPARGYARRVVLLSMPWNWDHPRRLPLQRLELLEEYWRILAPTGRVVTCASYRVDGPGIEVRAGYSPTEFHSTQRVADATHARVVAEMWLCSLIANGLRELPTRHSRRRS